MTPIQRNRSGERNTERQRDVQRKTTTEVARKHQRRRGVSSIFSVTQDDEALPQDLFEPVVEDEAESPDFEDFADDEDDSFIPEDEDRLDAETGNIMPIWLWTGSRIIWSCGKFGWGLRHRETFRRAIERFLRILSEDAAFHPAHPAYALGVFRGSWFPLLDNANVGKTKGSWVENCSKAGLLVPGERGMIRLDRFFAGQGRGAASLPTVIERRMIEFYCADLNERGTGKLLWKSDVPERILDVHTRTVELAAKALRGVFGDLLPEDALPNVLEASTLQRKRFSQYRQWISNVPSSNRRG